MAARRVVDPRQQGARLSWLNDLFLQVPSLEVPPAQPAAEPLRGLEVRDSDMGAFDEAVRQVDLVAHLRKAREFER